MALRNSAVSLAVEVSYFAKNGNKINGPRAFFRRDEILVPKIDRLNVRKSQYTREGVEASGIYSLNPVKCNAGFSNCTKARVWLGLKGCPHRECL